MKGYVLRGRVIDRQQRPLAGLRVTAWDDDPLLDPDDLLGEAATAPDGRFRIAFDRTAFAPFWAMLEGTPDVYLQIDDAQGRHLLTTRILQTRFEIEYHIRVAPHRPDPRAPDLYARSAERFLAGFRDVGAFEGQEYRLNVDMLRNNPRLPTDVRARLAQEVAAHAERRGAIMSMLALLDGLVTTQAEIHGLRTIGYDGPQVPRQPWREPYEQVVQWPRQEVPKPWA